MLATIDLTLLSNFKQCDMNFIYPIVQYFSSKQIPNNWWFHLQIYATTNET